MRAVNLKADQLRNPLGLQNRQPRITWNCEGGMAQSGYEYEVSVNETPVYASGKIESNEMAFFPPIAAKEKERVCVSLSLYDENGVKGETSEITYEAGLDRWEARWIDPEVNPDKKVRQPASVLRKEFTVKKSGRGRMYITCHGLYEAYLNNRRVGDFVLAPGTDDYRKRLQYQIYDVSSLIQEGKNEITVTVADGWYRGNNGIDGVNHLFGDDLALLCQIEVDGKAVLISDYTWLASQSGPIRFSDLEIGEVYDATMEEVSSWHGVKEKDYGYANLVLSDEVPIQEQEVFEGKRITTPDGSIVYDFSQNMAGYSSFEVNAKEGQRIVLWHGEALDKEGNFTQANFDPGKRNQNGGIPQKVEYICKEGKNVFHPHFSIFGFQYVKVETDCDLSDAKFSAIAVYSAMKETAKFECSNADVNQLFHNSMWSMKSNFVDIPTDCPQRERSGWTGDAGVFVSTGVLLHECYSVFRKWLSECRLNQKKNGIIRNIAPPINDPDKGFSKILDGSTGWGDAIVIVPYTLYQMYGDKRILEENYDAMVGWVGYLKNLAKKNSLKDLFKKDPHKEYVITKGFHWGEWCQPDVNSGDELRNNFTKGAPKSATAYYFYSAKLLSEIAEVLGKEEDARQYAELSSKVREAYISSFTEEGIVHSDRQCDYVRPLQFDLIDKKKENAALLNEMVKNNGYHLNTGFLSTPFLCSVLEEYGYVETAYKLLLQTECPSWLYSVKKGATTIWEHWKGLENEGGNASLNHYSYGAIYGWLIRGVCGIEVKGNKVTIRPYPCRLLDYAKAEYDSPLGKIVSGWKYDAKGLEFSITLPSNVEAEVQLPNGQKQVLQSGTHTLRMDFQS